MALLLEIYLSLIRIFLLFTGILITVVFGEKAIMFFNSALQALGLPCIELMSFLIIVLLPLGMLYGIHIQKYFWQRTTKYNSLVFLFAFLIGVFLTAVPIDSDVVMYISGSTRAFSQSCFASFATQPQFAYIVGSGIIGGVFGLIGMDFGVALKHVSKKISTHKQKRKR